MIYQLIVQIVSFVGDIQKTLSDYTNTFKIFDILRVIADLFGDNVTLQKCYLEMGDCCKAIGDYRQAQLNYERFLQQSWYIRDVKSELKAYDLIGITYFYQNNMERARRYHRRSLCCDSALENESFSETV